MLCLKVAFKIARLQESGWREMLIFLLSCSVMDRWEAAMNPEQSLGLEQWVYWARWSGSPRKTGDLPIIPMSEATVLPDEKHGMACFNRRRQWHPTPVLLPGKSHGWRSLVGCSPWDCWGLHTTERLHFHFSLSCIGEGNGNPLQCSCLENPRDGGA